VQAVPARSDAVITSRVLPAVVLVALVVSGIGPADRLTWLLEVLPVLIVAPLLVATARRFPLTPLLYWLIATHALILMVGGHYTYAQVPLGFWMQDAFDFSRNHYDRIGHLMQGICPAIAARGIVAQDFAAAARQMAVRHRVSLRPRHQRVLRVHRVVGGAARRRRRGRIPRHPGRCLGHAVGHVLRRLRGNCGAGRSRTNARSATAGG
jgi:hypothetical protein